MTTKSNTCYKDYASMSVGTLRALARDLGISRIPKTKAELVQLLRDQTPTVELYDKPNTLFSDVIDEEDHAYPVNQNDDKPTPNDPEWTKYVLSLLQDYELKNGNPTVDGLRRITGIVLGDILDSETEILEIPDDDYHKCTASHTITIRRIDGEVITVRAAVDVRFNITEAPYNQYLVATADTRAEGKALRRALKLSVITAEETLNKEDEIDSNELVNENQINIISLLSTRLDINPLEMIPRYTRSDLKSVESIPAQVARTIISELSHYQRNISEIPNELKGYNADWRKKFNVNSKNKRKS